MEAMQVGLLLERGSGVYEAFFDFSRFACRYHVWSAPLKGASAHVTLASDTAEVQQSCVCKYAPTPLILKWVGSDIPTQ